MSIKMKTHSSLHAKFIRGILPITLISLIVLGFASAFITFQTRKNDAFEISQKSLNYIALNIDKTITRHISNFSVNVDAVSMDQVKSSTLENIISRLIISESEDIVSVNILNLEGKNIAYSQILGDEILQDKIVGSVKMTSKNRSYISNIKYIGSKAYIRLAVPMKSKENRIIAVISGVIDLSEIIDLVNKEKIGEFGFIQLLDRQNRIIASGEIDGVKLGDKFTNTQVLQKLEKSKNKSILTTGLNNQYSILTSNKINTANWQLISHWPAADAFSVMFTVAWQIVVIIIAASAVGYIFSWIIAVRITRPIDKIREAAIILGQGNFHYRINFQTNDELDDLIYSFNNMSLELERLVSEIIQKQKTITSQKDEFVFIAAHELRSPVTAIRWILDDIIHNERKLSKEQKDIYLQKAFSANERLVQLVSDLLEVARSDAGRLKVLISDISIKEVIKRIINELSPLASEKQQKLVYKSDLATVVKADESKIGEVVTNLISNAIKYMKLGGQIEIWHEEKDGMLNTYVKDNGIGISLENQKQLFTKFYRVESDETRDIEGTGLGLFITKELIERMGGKIWIDSKPGLGSIFAFSLPKSKEL